ncbi:baculovirus F protein domain-containing protein [Phthorimaea operculella]|nr:baculovirus F protein domain-containing protein [Phthorimaea operculella]
MILQIVGTTASTYSVRSVEPGIYVEHIGTANIDRGTFRIETNYKKENLEQYFMKIQSAITQFNQLCKAVVYETHCNQFYKHLLEEKAKFERTKEYLTEINQTRRKRGLLGQFLTSIFGVNDEVYRDIDTLNQNQQNLINTANQQTKLMISTISQVNNTEEKIKEKLERYQTKLNTIIEYIDKYNHWYTTVDNNHVNIQIMQTYQLANNFIQEISEHYSGLLDIFLSRATVYSILTPKNVSDLIKNANKILPSNLRINQQLLLETKIAENETHIQVYAYFPIQDITKYTLIHITPIPQKNNDNSYRSITVVNNYLGIDYNNELYFELNHEQFKGCLQKSTSFLCFPVAVKNMQLQENCIVAQLFKNKTVTTCETKLVKITNTILWKQLYMQNTWLFIAKGRVTTSIICDGQRTEIELRNVGVIHISDNCIIKLLITS